MTSPAAGEEEEERLFRSPPRSFKMDCKSPMAAKLQASIAAKLVEFLGNYSDDVLAEYIVVLVCNGKHQNQARTELQEFLGNESGKFVSWLWNHLSEDINLSNGALDSSNSKVKLSTSHDDIIENVHKAAIADVPLFKNGTCEPYTFSSKPSRSVEDPENLQRWCPTSDAVLLEADSEITLKQTFTSHRNSGAPDYNYSSVKECPSVGVRYSPDSSSVGEHRLHYDNQVQKIARSNSSDVTCHPLTVEAEPVPRSLRSVIAVSHQPKHISTIIAVREKQPSTAMDAVLHQNIRPRRNVWDRLGKPCNEDDGFTRQNQSQHKDDISDRTKLDHNGVGLHKLRPVQVVPDAILSRKNAAYDSYGRVISNNQSDDHAIQDLNFHAVGTHDRADNSKRKRLFSEFSSGDSSGSSSGRKGTLMQIKQAFPKLQESLPTTNNCSQNLQEISSEAKIPTTLVSKSARHPFKTSSRPSGLESNKVPQVQLNSRRASDNIPVQNLVQSGKTESVLLKPNAVALEAKTGHKPMQDEATLVKSRLDQVQMDVLKLRYKQAEMHIEPKVSQNNPEEDIEPRTVLVTNVHFAASREAVLQHFTNCGHVLKVILLTDTITAQPKGAAYIVFSSKESAEKALKMSGTSLFCRQLMVMRKADMPAGFLVPSQLVGKIPQPVKKGAVHRPYSSSNLQWRREQPPTSGESSVSAPPNGLGSSRPPE